MLACIACAALAACTAPRSVLLPAEVLGRGRWEAGIDATVNVPTQTTEAMYGGLEKGIKDLYARASGDQAAAITADSLNGYFKAMLAYSLDPIGFQPGVYVRYGAWRRVDAGFERIGGANVFDARWQFLGPVAGDSAAVPGSPWRASIGARFSAQSFDMPSVAGLDKLQSLLDFEFTRKDLLIPLAFGKPFGDAGRFGGFAVGAAYDAAFIEYASRILKLAERTSDGATRAFSPLRGEKVIHSYGGFANARLGYSRVFLAASLACYRQDYGTYGLFGGKRIRLGGWTFIPAAALDFRF
jgi:hypothetical protein